MVSRAILNGWPIVPPSRKSYAPVFTVQPSISGTFASGQTLTVSYTADAFPVATASIRWLRDGVAISGAIASTYVLTGADVGSTVSSEVMVTNALGSVTVRAAGSIVQPGVVGPREQLIATRGYIPSNETVGPTSTSTQRRGESRMRVKSGRYPATNIRMHIGNFRKGGGLAEVDGVNPVTVDTGVELASVNYRGSFGGSVTQRIEANGPIVACTFPTLATLQASTAFLSRFSVTVDTLGQQFPRSCKASGEAVENNDASQAGNATALTPGASGAARTLMMVPLGITGVPTVQYTALYLLGDSNGYGYGDVNNGNSMDASGNYGMFARGLDDVNGYTVPVFNGSRSGDLLNSCLPAQNPRQWYMAQYCTDTIIQLGTNDMTTRAIELMQADFLAEAAYAKTATIFGKVFAVTVPPRTNGTNTAALGTFGPGEKRDLFNAWLYTQIGVTIDGVLDFNRGSYNLGSGDVKINAGIETDTTCLWRDNSYISNADGTHYNPVSNNVAAQVVNAFAVALEASRGVEPYPGRNLVMRYSRSGALDGATPDKGAPVEVSGPGAGLAVQSGGYARLSADAGGPAYLFHNIGVPSKKLVAKWRHTAGTFDKFPTIAICEGKDGMVSRLLHGELGATNMVLRLMRAGFDFRYPHWHLQRAPHTLATLTDYDLELHWDAANPNWSRLVHRASGGAIINLQAVYDPRLPEFLGPFVFDEPWNTRLLFDELVSWEASEAFSYPSLTIGANVEYTGQLDGWVQAPFGGGTVQALASAVRISGTQYPNGGGRPYPGTFLTGESVWVSADFENMNNMDFAFVNGGGAVSNVEIVANRSIIVNPANDLTKGRVQALFTFTANVTNPILAFLASSVVPGTPGSIDLKTLHCVTRPPTSI